MAPESTDDRLIFSRIDARRVLGGIGETKLTELEAAGEIEYVRIGRRVFVTADSLHDYIERLRQTG